jgi:acetyltransferase-like isoleucine patch superfamily enzyme
VTGASSMVTKGVPPFAAVVGNPVKIVGSDHENCCEASSC